MQRCINNAARWVIAAMVVSCLAQGCAIRPASPPAVSAPPPLGPPGEPDAATLQRADAHAHYAAGAAAELTGRPEAALDHFQQALTLDPHNPDLGLRVANILMSRRRFAEAVQLLEQLTTAQPRLTEGWFWLGVAHKAQDHPTAALTAWGQVLRMTPIHRHALQLSLELQLQQNDLPAVVALLEQARRQKITAPGDWVFLGDLATLALKEKSELQRLLPADYVLSCFEKARALAPDDPELLQRLASYHHSGEDPQQALDYYTQLVNARPDVVEHRIKLAGLHLQVGQRAAAIREFEEVLKREPLRVPIRNLLAELYLEAGDDQRARDYFQESLVIQPKQLEPHLNLASLHIKQHEYDAALATLDEAEGKFPTDFRVPYLRGLLHSDQRDFARALAAFATTETLAEQAGATDRLDANFHFHYGAACERTGDIDRAAQRFQQTITLDPKHHMALNYLGYMWAEKGIHLAEAETLIQRALALEPDNPAYLDSLGWVLFKQGRAADALSPLRRAADLLKEPDATVFDHLAEVLLSLGQRADALTWLQRAAAAEPDNQVIADKLKRLLEAAP